MTSPWPFSMWGIDLIGHMPAGKGGVKYVMVAVDYFTKWVEAEPLATITAKKLKDFVFKNIVCRYGIPHTLISDNGKKFDNEELSNFAMSWVFIKNLPQSQDRKQTVNLKLSTKPSSTL